ncbi:undecaprenyl-diphosphatase UppP [Eggerthia catenaformis OT 569 = DSM 20559]|uniref:Undecaprenyl-diphosphatase n=1 Tax=Eggerthia catenaformis OT 569 = DSM 20559 TaxID=999415 RepID=M2Q1U1_9FIRM|nr:undecaprenyl-diphosphate phosphatase [Eggerthia catenaformis]EMD16251.1 undecaprenyl-diphosphatase UppP [Eggerthia catenaformis OT 569 = DSM 20559]OUC50926.1 undecaprenyl-diphosphatase [Eggerthia catenaformis]
MIKILISILFGIVEGITEWLPISSTGHMILLNKFISLETVTSAKFYSMYEVVIQLGAILAVVVIFWDKIWPFQKSDETQKGIKKYVKMPIIDLWLKIILACLPAAVIGLAFDELFEKWFYNYWCVAIALIVFGIAFIIVENKNEDHKPRVKSLKQLNGKTALEIGFFQLIAAIFPGTSRSGSTIVGSLMLGVSRTTAAEFTFFLAIPVMFGASLLKIVKFGFAFSMSEIVVLLTGMLVAFLTSLMIIRFLMDYIKKHDFKIFGYYRIALGVIVLLYGIFLG